MKYIATISGGKDSVTMCDLLLKNGYAVDEIIFTDTLEEFKEMYIYIEKIKIYFKQRYNKEIVVLKPKTTFTHWAFGTIEKQNAKRIGQIRGIPTKDGMCYWRRESKIYPMERYLKEKYKNEEITFYIGYTMGENRSVQETNTFKYSYPLQDVFKMNEENCKAYLIAQEMENPLYKHFSRTGCALCPFQSDKSWFNVWKHYPDVWKKMFDIEHSLYNFERAGMTVINKHFFMGNKTLEDMEKIFIEKDKQGSLFDFSDEPIKDCFCKI